MQSSKQISSTTEPKGRTQAHIGVLLLVIWTISLTTYTLQIQHSSHPLLTWPNDPPRKHTPDPPGKHKPDPDPDQPGKTSHKPGNQGDTAPGIIADPPPGDPTPPIVPIAAGAAAAVGAAVVGAPVAIIAGAGLLVWFAAKTIMGLSS